METAREGLRKTGGKSDVGRPTLWRELKHTKVRKLAARVHENSWSKSASDGYCGLCCERERMNKQVVEVKEGPKLFFILVLGVQGGRA